MKAAIYKVYKVISKVHYSNLSDDFAKKKLMKIKQN